MLRAQHAIVSLVVGTAIAVIGGCSSDTTATPQVIFTGTVLEGSSTTCGDSGTLFTVGSFGNAAASPPQPSVSVPDGTASGQGTASVACSVTPAGTNLFNVTGEINVTGATGGLFRIDGVFNTTGDQTNIHVIASAVASANKYEEQDRACIVRYDQPNMTVAAGRVWGDFTCPNVINLSDSNRSCEITGEFRFENCAQ